VGPRARLNLPLPIPRRGTGPRWAGPFLLAAGLALLVGWAGTLAAGQWRQWDAEARWDQLDGTADRPGQVPPPPALARPLDGVDFRLRVPRLAYRAVVREGVTADVLFGGPGHYPETAWPGQPGTVGVAAHNVYWLRFDQLGPGDELILDTRYGTFRYRVTGSRVVGPDDRSVLAAAPGRRLTLTTCWPLWAGQLAPFRLAVFAA
jgi:LPXTG-site transpeptidase (sortase) family protein